MNLNVNLITPYCKKFLGIYQEIDWYFPMNYGKYDTICCKCCFYLLICNELSCIDQWNQLLIIKNTMNIITILHPWNFNVLLHDYFLQCLYNVELKTKKL